MNALDALYRCQRAWEATQPQLFMELWPDDGLDDTHADSRSCGSGEPVCVVEPGAAASPEAAGLEPRLTAGEGLLPGVRSTGRTAGADGEHGYSLGSTHSPAVSRVLNPGDTEPRRAYVHGELTVPRAAPPTPSCRVEGGSVSPLTYDRPRPQDVAVNRGRGQEVTV